MQKYNFELKFVPGKTMLVSDALGRSYLNDIEPEFDKNIFDMYISSFQIYPLVSPDEISFA